ncbi:MAG: glucose-6-phosphate isomerase [Alicyclobacillaceae bacterium]|jgi:glucose-6-phosphate isomerase|uniref:glucose-6-phosphate isomerase n=1 Tax=Alicyclobacillus sp. SP_1 TaxID=2942475 RepID=UPI0021574A21|nr:glucose-6-phosphate isomerase [Alicyclobacillus sp. SP_1]MCY0887780.1 glucose-6-phosphate isomerase [Alicyclobacillaceae bacterium]MCY0896059.1 glucose-6-phosphate isomerase [Alicyclobacillaceae bacterium]
MFIVLQLQLAPVDHWFQETHMQNMIGQLELAHRLLWDMNVHKGNKGWLHWPAEDHKRLLEQVFTIANQFRQMSDVTVVVGIGGSYLGARAALSMMGSSFPYPEDVDRILFAGNQLSSQYMTDLLRYLDDHEVTLVVISKSGGTLEPQVAFHVLRDYLEERYGENSKERICAITDESKGALNAFARLKGYSVLPIPRDIGGRYSVLTAVGLLPMAIAGLDVDEVMASAADAYNAMRSTPIMTNPAFMYAALRHFLYMRGFTTEVMVTYEPQVAHFAAWWQQLFGESQGKDGTGLFPTTLQYTTDLHSMGQYVQDSRKFLMETVLDVHFADEINTVVLPEDLDEQSQYLAGKTFEELQDVAVESVVAAHVNAGVPNVVVRMSGPKEQVFGELVYFFEFACAIGGYLAGVNPFDQPGVEAYKQEMQSRLR